MMLVDLHVHTNYSVDASISPKTLVDALYAHPAIKAVAITDHNTTDGYFQVRKLADTYQDLLIIPGVEVGTTRGDVILLGVEENPPFRPTPESAVDFAKQRDAVVIIPHPYRIGGIGDIAEKIYADAIEILNPWATPAENKLAEQLAKARNLPGVAGSDAHKPTEMLMVCTEVDSESEVSSVLKAIRNGRVKIVSARRHNII